jgi:YHS domain-containing protein
VIRQLLLLAALLLLARAIWRFVVGVLHGAVGPTQASPRPQPPAATRMMQDPVCGTYVVPGKALELSTGGRVTYFCSERCRDQWAASSARR